MQQRRSTLLLYFKHNPVYYWAIEQGTAEVDFMLKQRQEVIQIEVKAEENLKAKNLKVHVEQFQPKQAIRLQWRIIASRIGW